MSDNSGNATVVKNVFPHVDAVRLRYETRNPVTFEIETEEVFGLKNSFTDGVVYLSIADLKKVPKILEKVFADAPA